MSWICHVCGNDSFNDGDDGFHYCNRCNSQADDFIEAGIDNELILGTLDEVIYSKKHTHFQTKDTQMQSQQDVEEGGDTDAGDGVGPTGPRDFGSAPMNLSYDEYYTEIRSRYVKGFQILIQLQVKALVEKFKVSPLIVGLVGPIWLRFLAVTRIMADEWANEVVHESESQIQGEADAFFPRPKHKSEPHNMLGQRAVTLWLRSLSNTIPLSYSLAMSFLVCHLARESILPTDMIRWTLEGKLPYFAAFLEIEQQLGPPSGACPISSIRMFRPVKAISLQKLESLAATIAQKIGLTLPPVNFYGIASRFLVQLSIPVNNILRQACRICDWSMPPELCLSANTASLPTRICVMSILIVTIRILYDLNGSGKWEMSLYTSRSSSSLDNRNAKEPLNCTFPTDDTENLSALYDNASDDEDLELDAIGLLKILDSNHNEIRNMNDYSEDLSSYLKYCKDVVFAGLGPSFEDYEEEQIIQNLWDFYQNEGVIQLKDQEMYSRCRGLPTKKSTPDMHDIPQGSKEHGDTQLNCSPARDATECGMDQGNTFSGHQDQSDEAQSSMASRRDEAIRQLKLDMEENRFSYVPPRPRTKKMGYVFYQRRRIEGGFAYACHAEYYILLRACAKVAQVDLRCLHLGVMRFERRLKRSEMGIDKFLRVKARDNIGDSPSKTNL